MNEERNLNSPWKSSNFPRGKSHKRTQSKTTVSLYVDKNLVGKARNRGLNLSSVMNQALSSILDYVEAQNIQPNSNFSLSSGSLFGKRESEVDRAGFEPAASALRTRRSYRADLPAHLGAFPKK